MTKHVKDFDAHFDARLASLNEHMLIIFKNMEEVGIIIGQDDNLEYRDFDFEKRHFNKE